MIAASLKDAAGDPIINLLLRKGADVNVKSGSGQVRASPVCGICITTDTL